MLPSLSTLALLAVFRLQRLFLLFNYSSSIELSSEYDSIDAQITKIAVECEINPGWGEIRIDYAFRLFFAYAARDRAGYAMDERGINRQPRRNE
jgi:hypothetical protein